MRINLEEGTIKVKGNWYSSAELTRLIQEKMHAGDMRFAELAASLEELNSALEHSHALNVKIVLSKKQYRRLKHLGQSDDRECIRKAIRQFVESGEAAIPSRDEKARKKKNRLTVRCANCDAPIKIEQDRENNEIHCSACGARGVLKHRK